MMDVTELQIVPVKPSGGLVGFASFVLDGKLYLGSIGIYTRTDGNGYRLTYPTRKLGERNMHIFHPISREASNYLEAVIGERFESVMHINHDRHHRPDSPAL